MSHFTVTVAVSGADVDDARQNITTLLAPFDENLEVAQRTEDGEIWWYNPDAKWDWYQIGGRRSGELKLHADAADGDYTRGERFRANENELATRPAPATWPGSGPWTWRACATPRPPRPSKSLDLTELGNRESAAYARR